MPMPPGVKIASSIPRFPLHLSIQPSRGKRDLPPPAQPVASVFLASLGATARLASSSRAPAGSSTPVIPAPAPAHTLGTNGRAMGLLSHRVERSELKPGDHIYTWRAAYSYSHHGIYVGGSKVVHFTTKKEAGTAGLDSAVAISSLISAGSPECPTFPDCGFHIPDSGVILTCLDCFLRDGALHGFEYGVPPAVFLAKLRGGTCTTAASDPADAVVHRAMYLLQNGFGSYDVFENNCEDFALYCKTGLLLPPEQGIGRSGQAASAVGVPLAALFSTPFRLMSAGPLGMAAVTAGMYCAGRYITDIGVRKDVVKVEVENLSAHLGWRRAKAEEEEWVKKKQQPAKVTRLLPLKRKRDSDLHLQSVK